MGFVERTTTNNNDKLKSQDKSTLAGTAFKDNGGRFELYRFNLIADWLLGDRNPIILLDNIEFERDSTNSHLLAST